MPASSDPARLALDLAALGWHILPLSPASKRPLGNCPRLPPRHGTARPPGRRLPLPGRGRLVPRRPRRHHRPRHDHRLVAARAPRGARRRRRALRAGPGRHRRPRRPAPAQPGHRPAARHRPGRRAHPARRVGRPGPVPRRPRQPDPAGPAPRRPPPLAHRPRAPAGHRRHPLRRRAPVVPGTRPRPPPGPRDPHGRYGLAWQIDLKAGWSYGIAPGAATTAGTYQIRGGDPARPGRMPAWLAREVIRATTTAPRQPATPPPPSGPAGRARPPTSPPSSAAAPPSSPP